MVGAEPSPVGEALTQVRDEPLPRNQFAFRVHVVLEGLEHLGYGHGKRGLCRQRPIEIEEVATLLPPEQPRIFVASISLML